MDLVVTADDFGRSSAINAAVRAAHQEGILTSASLMVGGEAFDEAVQIARAMPTLAVGLHVVIVDGSAVLEPARLGGLVDQAGRFPDGPARLGIRYFFSPGARRRIAAEIVAQFERFAATGLPLDHVNGHQHLHLHPAVFPLIVSLAARYRARGMRLPRESASEALLARPLLHPAKLARAAAVSLVARHGRRLLRESLLATVGRVHGLVESGQMHERYVIRLLEHLAGPSAEIYFHPTTGPRTDRLGPNPEDLHALLSPAVREVILRRNIRLCAYAGLRGEPAAWATP